jgi:hypothetical protein
VDLSSETGTLAYFTSSTQMRTFGKLTAPAAMADAAADLPHHKKTLHSKRSFGKYPRTLDSPAYDA